MADDRRWLGKPERRKYESLVSQDLGRTRDRPPHYSETAESGLFAIKEDTRLVERRHGPGRRAGDLERALEHGIPVVYKLEKLVKGAGKLAEKVIKKKLKLGP